MDKNPRNIDLLTNDLYQFTCSYCYFTSGTHEQEATFEIFFRSYPFGGEYAIFAGLESAKDFIMNLKFTEENEKDIKNQLPNISQEWFEWIKQDFRSKITVKSMKEGEIIFSKEPLISYTGPLGFVQLLETPLLNLLGFATLVATNASRMVKAVEPKKCLEFGLRRAQGPDGGLSASQYAFLGGFSGTSNVQAAKTFGIPCVGTMSHAFVTSFSKIQDAKKFQINGVDILSRSLEIRKELGFKTHDGELASFIMFAKAFPNTFSVLIDTYNTIESGLLNAIVVGKALIQAGIVYVGIRLDSGDLCHYSIKCRQIWNKYVPDHRLTILASDDLNEEKLVEMEKNKSQIDIYAIGTQIATCKKQPALGLVCKLVQLNQIPKMKFSEDIGKATYPGKKTIYRVWTDGKSTASFDLMSIDGEQIGLEITTVDPKNHEKSHHKIAKIQILNNSWNFKELKKASLNESKQFAKESMSKLPIQVFALKNPSKFHVLMTQKYVEMFRKTSEHNHIGEKKH